jgi:glycosyltransferase involved in cell wall biosynthesis
MMLEPRALPLVTVVTVVWNNLPGLQVTAKSVAAQDYESIEHLVVDGGSTDGSLPWLQENPLGHRMVWQSEPDEGIYDAMNKGLAGASGELILFLNGGDALAHDSVIGEVARDWRENNWVWGYGSIRYIDQRRRPIREYSFAPFSRRRLSRAQAFVPHPATFVQTDVMRDHGGFRKEFGFSADQDFMVRISEHHSPRIFDQVFTNYLIDGAHAASSYWETARRYQRIRRSNHLPIGGGHLVDAAFTAFQAAGWQLRASLSTIRRGIGKN